MKYSNGSRMVRLSSISDGLDYQRTVVCVKENPEYETYLSSVTKKHDCHSLSGIKMDNFA